MSTKDFTWMRDIDLDIQISKIRPRSSAGGTWVAGTCDGYRWEALVFPEHAEVADYEIEDSRISKLFIQRIADKWCVFNWDRGLDIEPQTDQVRALVGFLACGLADFVFAE